MRTLLVQCALIAGLSLVTLLGGCSGGSERPRTIVLGIDGLDPGVVDLLMSEGRMPNFARLRQGGAYGRLVSSRPLLSPIIWTTIATGRLPADHQIGHFVAINEQTGEQLPVTSQMRKVKALWNILSEVGRKVAVVGWWATWPAEAVEGVVASDHTCYHFLFDEGATGASDTAGIVYPPARTDEILQLVRRPGDIGQAEIARYVDVPAERAAAQFAFQDDLSHFKWALATAHSYTEIGLELWKRDDPDLMMLYVEGVDSSSHLFGHLFRAEGLKGELAEQQQHYGRTVEQMYELADEIVGRYLEVVDDDTTLVVLSDHGFDLGVLHGDPSKTRDMRRVSERFHKIEGVLYMYGRGVKPAARLDRPVLVDVAPTLLALAGLGAAADMPGRVLTEGLTFEPPIRSVATYEGGRATAAASATGSASVDSAILERLRSLGYLDTASPTGERNLASLHFESGRYEDAVEAYRKLIEEKPEDGSLRASLAGTLGALGRYDEALEELDHAERLSPLNPESYHNRGVIYERQGKLDDAITQYRQALRYSPDYEPSRNALVRLTGTSDATGPRTDSEKLAGAMAERAAGAARRGDYAAALATLEEAARIAPQYALVYQYRANVAFLMNDREQAVAALVKALELEPDNALYRQNLETLRRPTGPDGASPASAADGDDPTDRDGR
jgi:predicted AlkP superfamily phosphohydrolase/phosphomutase/Flp pilus assembly protein TadD